MTLGDFDIATKLDCGTLLQTAHAFGNVMWHSPEAKTDRRVTKASGVLSFRLVGSELFPSPRTHAKPCSQGCMPLEAKNYCLRGLEDMENNGLKPEQGILFRHLLYFGMLRRGLLDQINVETWIFALQPT